MRRGSKMAFPKTLREQQEASQRSMNFYAAMADKPDVPLGPPLPPKRSRAPSRTQSEIPLEKDVQRNVLAYLHLHPKVAFVGRFNRGTVNIERNGRLVPYKMNTIPGFPDVHGMLKSGRPFYFECKRLHTKPTEDQQRFLDLAQKFGALAAVIRCVEDARDAIKDA